MPIFACENFSYMNNNKLLQHIIILAVAFSFTATIAIAQQFRSYQLPTQNLLPVSQIHAVTQSYDGLMWYATSDGLCRDNGYYVDVFKQGVNDGGIMRSNDIKSLATKDGRLFFGTTNGAYVLDLRTYHIDSIPLTEKAGNYIHAILAASDKFIWIETAKRIVRLKPDLSVDAVIYDSGCGGGSLFEDSNHRIWHLQKDGGISVWEKNNKHFHIMPWQKHTALSEKTWPSAVCEIENNKLLIGTWGQGIVLYNAITGQQIVQQASLSGYYDDQCVISMVVDKYYGIVWVTTKNGLDSYIFANGKLVKVSPVMNLPHGKMIVDKLFESRNGDIWVSGFTPTTFIISPYTNNVVRMGVPEMRTATGFGLAASRMVLDDTSDTSPINAGNNYWIWQERKGLCLYHEGQTITFPKQSQNYGHVFIRNRFGKGIIACRDDSILNLWYDGNEIKVRRYINRPIYNVVGLCQDLFGRLWIARSGGLYAYSELGGILWELNNRHITVFGGTTSSNNSCWYADSSKVCFTTVKGETRSMDIGEYITCMAVDGKDSVWVGTRSGHVYYCGLNSFLRQTNMDDSKSASIKDIKVDDWGNVWTLTDHTACKLDTKTGLRMSWTADDPDVNVDFYSALVPERRGMGIACAGAYCVIPYNTITKTSNKDLIPMVTAVTTSDSIYFIGYGEQTLKVPSEVSSIEISLATGEHLFAKKVTFAYRLGKKGQWTTLEQGQNRVYINHLTSGRTEVYVRATDRFGNWSIDRLCLTIDKSTEWSWVMWAILICIIVGVSLGGLGVYVGKRIRRLKDLMELRDEMNIKQISLEPDDISAMKYGTDFMRKLLSIIEQHVGDTDYNVSLLAEDMNMSRASLFRKTKAMTGRNPTDMLKEIRLKKAAAMLQDTPHASISDIAAKVGFSSPQYFTKCFKDMFGVQPGQYRRSMGVL